MTEKNTPSPTPEKADSGSQALFQPIRSVRAFEEIATQIRTELAEGRLRVGNRLPSERALSEQFGVSRNTLREALRSLEHAGLLRLQKGTTGGAFITQVSGDTITTSMLDMFHLGALPPEKLTEARIWLESVIVREACLRATPEDLQQLRDNIQQAERAKTEGDFHRRVETHLEFHRILTRMTGNPIMVIVMDGVLAVLRHYVFSIGNYSNDFVLTSRQRFMKCMENRDVEGAVAEMEAGLKRLQKSYLSHAAKLRTAGSASTGKTGA